jgi:hypothetical protein
MRWAGHVARMGAGGGGNAYNILVGKPEVKNHLEDLDVDENLLLRWYIQKFPD